MEISNLPNRDFKIMVIQMFTECGRMEKQRSLTVRKYKKVPNRSYRAEITINKLKKIHRRGSIADWMKQQNKSASWKTKQ